MVLIMLNEHSTIGPVKMLRQGQTTLLNAGYLFVLNTLFNQRSIFSSGNDNSQLVSYSLISDEYSPQPLDKKVSDLKGFHASKIIGVAVDLKHKKN